MIQIKDFFKKIIIYISVTSKKLLVLYQIWYKNKINYFNLYNIQTDVYHVACLEKYYSDLPPNTAPAGYIAPNNGGPLFPKENQAGPVVDKLRQVLSKCKWARVGLGLPLVWVLFLY